MNGARDPPPRHSRDPRDGDGFSRRPGRDDYRDRGERDRGDREGDRPRRYRSRSPHRRLPRGGGRDHDHDTYRTSRSYREREREDRYRERRDDRAWDRDQNRDYRRDSRRDDGDRMPPRRERDLFDERRPRHGDRDGRGDRERRRSASPPVKPREPTPDLTDVVPVLQRKRRQTAWDIKPPGFEHTSAIMAKEQAGFAAPGSSRAQVEDAAKLRAFMNQSTDVASGASLDPVNCKQARQLLVKNVPTGITKDALQQFINLQLNGLNVVSGHDVCTSAFVQPSKGYAILEFKTSEDATVALTLDGVQMIEETGTEANGTANGQSGGLSIQRSKDYFIPGPSKEIEAQPGVVAPAVRDTPNKIIIANLPLFIDDDQLKELLSSLGQLKAMAMAREAASGEPRGFAFCEYADPAITDVAISSLNGIELGGQDIKLQRAHTGKTQVVVPEQLNVAHLRMLAYEQPPDDQSRVVVLSNIVTREELIRDDDYGEICEDISTEAVKFGEVDDIKIPRPQATNRENDGVGKIFIGYKTVASAERALKAMAGRKFNERTVIASYFSEANFEVGAW